MSLDAILETIRQTGEASVRALEARAREEADRLLAAGEAEAEIMRQEARRAASSAVIADQARIIHHARLEAMRMVGHAEQTIVEQALAQAHAQLAELRETPEYPLLLRRLTLEALEALRGSLFENEQLRLYADPRDHALLDAILRDMRQDVTVSYELETWGGVLATTDDRCISADNTLEARLISATPLLQRILLIWLTHAADAEPAVREIDTQSLDIA